MNGVSLKPPYPQAPSPKCLRQGTDMQEA